MLYIHLFAGSRVQFSVFAFDIFTYVECMNVINILKGSTKNAAAGRKSVEKMGFT